MHCMHACGLEVSKLLRLTGQGQEWSAVMQALADLETAIHCAAQAQAQTPDKNEAVRLAKT